LGQHPKNGLPEPTASLLSSMFTLNKENALS
jgi:hypothetical protein